MGLVTATARQRFAGREVPGAAGALPSSRADRDHAEDVRNRGGGAGRAYRADRQPADSAACGLRAPAPTRAMITTPRAMRYQTNGMKLLLEIHFMNQAMTA